jgi:CECR6/TMEM121 family
VTESCKCRNEIVLACNNSTVYLLFCSLLGGCCRKAGTHVTRVKYNDKWQTVCELTLSAAWLLYSAVIAAKIGILFGTERFIILNVKPESLLNGSVLRTALCLSSIIFFTLVIAHQDALAGYEEDENTEEQTSDLKECFRDRLVCIVTYHNCNTDAHYKLKMY